MLNQNTRPKLRALLTKAVNSIDFQPSSSSGDVCKSECKFEFKKKLFFKFEFGKNDEFKFEFSPLTVFFFINATWKEFWS